MSRPVTALVTGLVHSQLAGVVSDVSWHDLFNFSDYGQLVPLVHNALIAGAVLGVLGGVIGVLVITRDLPFAVHGISELSFAGAAAALLLGVSVVPGSLAGSVLAALVIGLLGNRARDRNSVIGVLMPFGLGLGILFLALYKGRAANKFGLLTGQIVAVDSTNLRALVVTAVLVLVVLVVIWRPLMFASVDTEVAAARGVPIRLLGPIFMVLAGVRRRAVGADRGCPARARAAGDPGGGRPARDGIAGAGRRTVRRLCDYGFGRRDLRGARHGDPDQPVRDHDLVPDLPRVPARRVSHPTAGGIRARRPHGARS